MPDEKPADWYEKGLSFGCTQCGNCCSGPPGFVWFTPAEAQQMAEFLQLDVNTFLKRYTRVSHGRYTLDERISPQGYDCVFLKRDEQGKALCSIYSVRPTQCKTWPFWPELLRAKESWDRATERCPGMNKGTFYPIEKIRIIRDQNPKR
jgi:uncharacterized protein